MISKNLQVIRCSEGTYNIMIQMKAPLFGHLQKFNS